jgi:uncharacterized protein (DUF2252 family)
MLVRARTIEALPVAHRSARASDDRARGKTLRAQTPRRSHAKWHRDQQTDPLKILEQTSAGRLRHLVPVRYGRMCESPLAFLRGEPLLMARDLTDTPRSGIIVQACGDAHLMNFGLFASPERNLLFDVNDFDETLPGPWEWDVKRLAASLVVAGRDFGLPNETCRDCVVTCAQAYREHLHRYADLPRLDVWYSRVDGDAVLKAFPQKKRQRVAEKIDGAHKCNHRQAVAELTEAQAGELRFREQPPLVTHARDLLSEESLHRILASYRGSLQDDRRHLFDSYTVIDHVLNVVGVGSVATRCFAMLLRAGPQDECIVLQVKEATPSVLEGLAGPPWHANQGARAVEGQRLIQGFNDIFLGWGSDGQRDYYVRQLRDMKRQLTPAMSSVEELRDYGALCGWVLARAHARSGNALQLAGYLGKGEAFDDALATFALSYADQVERDYDSFQAAVRSGRLAAELGV